MNAVDVAPDEYTDALGEWSEALRLLHERLTAALLVSAWIAGLNAAGFKAEHAKTWKGKYPKSLPYVVAFECGHRTEDETDNAKVWLIVLDDGWVRLSPGSECTKCTPESVAAMLLDCPRCHAGEDSERHWPDHARLDAGVLYDGLPEGPGGVEYDDHGRGFDASPLSWVMREFERLQRVARARWWLERPEEAAQSLPGFLPEAQRQLLTLREQSRAREVLGAKPKAKASSTSAPAAEPSLAERDPDAWLDSVGVPQDATVRQAWAMVKDMPGRPAKNTIEKVLSQRRSRATES